MTKRIYDDFSENYDKFVNWENRLKYELPFIEAQIQPLGSPAHVLDAACGTGMHTIALSQKGYRVAGADLSAGMIKRARVNASNADQPIWFEQAGFGQMAPVFGEEQFDVVLCLGNSLPHLLSTREFLGALEDFSKTLRPGGMLMIQNRNFDAVLAQAERWMEPQAYREGNQEWIFLRFYDFLPEGLLAFNIITLCKEADGIWQQSITTTMLQPLQHIEMVAALQLVGFVDIRTFGDMTGSEYDYMASGNLVITTLKKEA